ncbi:GAF domain-containing protein [Specibacter sp. RAF43]|uniref:GAF domain-containing protein n=1 Tax=Specibacter sp. RAF43 TaxID=3233057 RepID=UPI003F992EC5
MSQPLPGAGLLTALAASVPSSPPALRFSDPERYARILRHAHADVIGGASRPEIAAGIQESWRRSLALGISPDQHSPRHVRDAGDVAGLRAGHPLAPVIPALTELLGDDSRDGRQLLIITDALGEVLWRIGSHDALALAETLEFVEGADWSESGIGTNAISEVLRTGAPGQLFSAEHLVRTHHNWACTAAPIRKPSTGELLGVLDVSGPLNTLTADSMRMVKCGVRVAEEILGRLGAGAAERAVPAAPAAAHHGIARIELLGERPSVVHADGSRVALTLRRAEIVALLCSRQHGWSADELAYELYGETGTAASVRIEMHRLRAVLGPVISSHPYHLLESLAAVVDASQVRAALQSGDVPAAMTRYHAPLLSRSTAMAVGLLREELDAAVRSAAHASASVHSLTHWLSTDMGAADTTAVSALEKLLGHGDPRTLAFAARARRLDDALR